jgi:hypothetical protein
MDRRERKLIVDWINPFHHYIQLENVVNILIKIVNIFDENKVEYQDKFTLKNQRINSPSCRTLPRTY